jgi:ABC-type multidrug transport system ATPase subunit/pSer/pThr/pTyr-binding forkhead associated (FHA) protein
MRRIFFMNRGKEPPTLGSLRFLTGPLNGNTYPITKAITSIGRDPSNDIFVSDPSVSRHHAQIIWDNGSWLIKKSSTQNTLTVNQHELSESPLHDRDTVGLGPGTTFLFLVEHQVPQQPNTPHPNLTPTAPSRDSQNPQVANPSYAPYAPQNIQAANQAYTPQNMQNVSRPAGDTRPAMAPSSAVPQVALPPQPLVIPAQGSYIPPAPFATERAPQPDLQQKGPNQRAADPKQVQASSLSHQVNNPSLEVSTNTDHDKQLYALTPDRQIFDIGRDPSNTIVINRPTVSSFHAQIVRDGNQLVLVHPHPSRGHTLNGLTYQGRTIQGNEQFRHVLSRGDVFRISDENGTFVTLTYNDGSGMAQEILPEIHPIPLSAPVITIGRAPDNTVVLNHPQVSGHHARLEQVHNGHRIINIGSTNGIYVNAERIHACNLKPSDEIRIGPFKLIYTGTQLTQHDESNSIRVDALHLKRTGNKSAILINDISFAVPPRKFVALVGGSGAGKSTLMNALSGIRPAQSGVVLYNGRDYYHHLAAFSAQLGYVPQDDIIHRDLSVERALYYAAKLRLPQDFTPKQIKERINEVLEDVEMKHRRHLLISKLSGGQRKRVSIALELLAKPSVFFLDEPTSGLDPGLDRKMMLLLRKLADKGHTIVLVTHATNNINACDYICFLCQGGRLAYYGPPNEAKAYFGKSDFAEIYSALEPTDDNPNIPAEAEARFKQSADYQRYVVELLQQGPAGQINLNAPTAEITPPKRGNPWKQFVLLSMRYLELILNDRVNLAILLLQAPIIGLILYSLIAHATFAPSSIATCFAHQSIATNSGPIVHTNCQQVIDAIKASGATNGGQILNDSIGEGSGGDAQKILFIMAFAAVMFGCINGAREIVKESAIYQRERTVNLGIAPYLFSKILVLGLFSLLQSFILVFLVNLKEPLNQLNSNSILFPTFTEIYISMALTALAGLMTGLLISAIVPNNDRAMSLIPLPLLPQVIFAGVIFSLDKPPFLQVLGAFFAARWSMAAMGSTVGLHGDKLNADSFSYVGMLFTKIDQNSAHANAAFHLILCWLVLALMIVVQGFIIAWLLKKKDVRR